MARYRFLYSRKAGEPPFIEDIRQEVFQSDDPELRAEVALICCLSAQGPRIHFE